MNIRSIERKDNAAIKAIIKNVMTEFGANPATTVLGDPSINTMYENYQEKNAAYFVASDNGILLGGAGIRQLDGAAENICELQRMFILPEARGKGTGKKLMQLCLEKAKKFGYEKVYLESLSNMSAALSLYEKTGFRKIKGSLGNTGHGGCNVFMILEL